MSQCTRYISSPDLMVLSKRAATGLGLALSGSGTDGIYIYALYPLTAAVCGLGGLSGGEVASSHRDYIHAASATVAVRPSVCLSSRPLASPPPPPPHCVLYYPIPRLWPAVLPPGFQARSSSTSSRLTPVPLLCQVLDCRH